jgi:hypothetical protein
MIKKLLLVLICLPFIGFGQNVNIPDANFKAYLVGRTSIYLYFNSEDSVQGCRLEEVQKLSTKIILNK